MLSSLPAYSFSARQSSIFGFPFRMGKIQTLEFRPSRNTLRCKKAKRPFAGREKKKNCIKKNPPLPMFQRTEGVAWAGHIKDKNKMKTK